MPLILNGTTGISGTDGSAATPAVQGTDTNTGMFFPAADQIAFAEGGVEAMRLDASGNVGIGTSSPLGKLKVTVGDVAPAASGNMNTGVVFEAGSGSRAVNIGVNNTAGFSWINAAFANNSGVADNLAFMTGATERARITSGGDLLLGTASTFGGSSGGLQVQNGGEQIRIKNTNNANYWRFVADNNNTVYIINQSTLGVFMANGASAWSGLSDERAKDIIEPIQDAANKVSQLRAVIGKYKVDEKGKRRSFLIAQDVQAVLPEAVSIADPETGHLGLAYTDVIPLLTAALQEALVEIASLKARVAVLEAN